MFALWKPRVDSFDMLDMCGGHILMNVSMFIFQRSDSSRYIQWKCFVVFEVRTADAKLLDISDYKDEMKCHCLPCACLNALL